MMTPRERTIKLLIRLLAHPYRYTRRDLMQHFGVSKDAIDDDINVLRNVGLNVDQSTNNHYRLAVLPDREFRELSYLQPLTDQDKAQLLGLFRYLSDKDATYLQRKLESLYDFQQLGLRALRKPALERIDRLETARKQQRQVILENYRSRSNDTKSRLVEPFHVDPEKDTLQAYDVEKRDSRHYRLSRIERVTVTDQAWAFENDHRTKITDVFRIADNEQVSVHLRMNVFAYNSLTEEFPLTLTYIDPGLEPNTFDFQCLVNHKFKGLLNFLMANSRHVDIVYPEALRDLLRAEAEYILKKIDQQ